MSITATVDVTLCWQCDRRVLQNHMERSGRSRIVMPDELPTTSGDIPRLGP